MPTLSATSRTRGMLRAIFLVSGAVGLAYEVVLQRLLQQIVGGTTESITIVLVAFMGGLAAGAHAGGVVARRVVDPLRAYGLCEVLVAGYAGVALLALGWSDGLLGAAYARGPEAFHVASFAVTGGIVLPLAGLLGASLPLVVEADARIPGARPSAAGLLYGINTVGAGGGALATGLLLLPAAGTKLSLGIAACGSAALGLGVLALARVPPRPSVAPRAAAIGAPTREALRLEARAVVIAYGLSGFLAMVLQVGWTRATALALGSSSYTFTIVVAAFVLGLGAGAVAGGQVDARAGNAAAAFGAILAAVGISSTAVLPLFGTLPLRAQELLGARRGFGAILGLELATLLALVGVPTFLMGMLYPVAVRLLSRGGAPGAAAAAAYVATTAGTIAGALAAGSLILPSFGLETSLRGACMAFVLLGAGCLVTGAPRAAPAWGFAVASLLAGTAIARRAAPWDQALLLSAPFMRDARTMPGSRASGSEAPRVVFYRDDAQATVAVTRVGDGYALRINGKTDASTFRDMPTQRLLAHLPLLLRPGSRKVCVVGMGSGVTAGSAALHPGVERIDQVEISQAVIEAAVWFSRANHDVLARPELRLRLADGRVHMRHSRERYDVVVSQPSNPWIAGIGNLFTEEYFRECRARLAPGGLMVAWLQTYQTSREAFEVVLRTFVRVFPGATAWMVTSGDVLLVAGEGAISLDLDACSRVMASPDLKDELADLGLHDPADLWSHVALLPGEVLAIADGGTTVNTDDNGWLELNAPRAMYLPDDVVRGEQIAEDAGSPPFELRGDPELAERCRERWPKARAAKRLALSADDAATAGDRERAEALARAALDQDAVEPLARSLLADLLALRSRDLVAAGRPGEALDLLVEIADLDPSDRAMRIEVATILVREGRAARALPWLRDLLRRDPGDEEAEALRRASGLSVP